MNPESCREDYQEKVANEELFDVSDADPDYTEESETNSGTDIPNKKLKTSGEKTIRVLRKVKLEI